MTVQSPTADANPYSGLGSRAFWRSAVADLDPLAIRDVWTPKYPIWPSDNVCTAGSCFAQHIGKALVERGFKWLDAEPAPRYLSAEHRSTFNYGVFSFRTSNIYTTALLRAWMEWAFAIAEPPDETWKAADRFFDPFRPTIEPNGFASLEELLASRATTLAAIRQAVTRSSVLVFTLGLTEAWINSRGFVYSSCPGTAAGKFDAERHIFRNFGHSEILADLEAALSIARSHNPSLRILLTVSPVPLTATASGEHVLVATTYSKSVLRSVAGEYVAGRDYADYFPSYELITGTPFSGKFFEPNKRSVTREGVSFVMDTFFECMSRTHNCIPSPQLPSDDLPLVEAQSDDFEDEKDEDDVVCEEILLEEFNRS